MFAMKAHLYGNFKAHWWPIYQTYACVHTYTQVSMREPLNTLVNRNMSFNNSFCRVFMYAFFCACEHLSHFVVASIRVAQRSDQPAGNIQLDCFFTGATSLFSHFFALRWELMFSMLAICCCCSFGIPSLLCAYTYINFHLIIQKFIYIWMHVCMYLQCTHTLTNVCGDCELFFELCISLLFLEAISKNSLK